MNRQPPPADLTSCLECMDRVAGLSAWVIGDLMLDEYVSGSVDRISPEAPVPIVRARSSEHRLGGAANVARQLATLQIHTSLAGVVGADATGEQVVGLCRAGGIDTRAVLSHPGQRTTRKLRVLAQNQQLLRLDWEDAESCPRELTDQILAQLKRGAAPDVIVLSDYAKGVLTPDLLAFILQGQPGFTVPVVVDPKRRDFEIYRGATVVTPNLRELELAWGRSLAEESLQVIANRARVLAERSGIESMVVTLGSRGLLVVPLNRAETVIPAMERPVYDVTGAGDTVAALLAACLAVQVPLESAARIANAAAGMTVGQIGAVAVSDERIRESLLSEPCEKLMPRASLVARVAAWRAAGKCIVFTNGCFDLLHAGHLRLLQSAAALGDVLIVAINSDASVRRCKGPSRPIVTELERAAMLAALSCVDAVMIFDEETPLETLQQIRPDVLVKGADYRLDQVVGRELTEASGGRVELIELLPRRSTTALLALVNRFG